MSNLTSAQRSCVKNQAAEPYIARLVAVWEAGNPPALTDILPADAGTSQIADVVCEDIARRVRAKLPVAWDEYLARYPQLAATDDIHMYLVEAEILGRQQYGPPPAVEEFVARFPALRERIERFFNPPTVPASPPGLELLEEIGRGGMGIVYRARDLALKREVAVKVLQVQFAADSTFAQRFLDEAQITAQLQHPGIPPVFQVGVMPNGRPFLAMKLIKGESLDDLLKAKEPVGAVAVFEAVCQAVGYAHEHGVLHRDLKPQNVMVGAFNEVQVMDWGLAKLLADTSSDTDTGNATRTKPATEILSARSPHDGLTGADDTPGTACYMSPEQAAGEHDCIDKRTDVFGLGGVLCALLTGHPPIEGETGKAAKVNATRGKTEAAFARLDASGADPELVGLCKRCLAFEPAARPANATAVAAEVARLRQAADDRARRAEVEKANAVVRAESEKKRRRILFASSALVVFVLGAGIVSSVVFALSERKERKERESAELQAKAAELETRDRLVDLAAQRGAWRDVVRELDPQIAAGRDIPVPQRFKLIQALTAVDSDRWADEIERVAGRTDLSPEDRAEITLWQADAAASRGEDGKTVVDLANRALPSLRAASREYALGLTARNTPEAVRRYEAALEANPFHLRAAYQCIFLQILSGRFSDAERVIALTAGYFPEAPAFPYFRAMIAAYQGKQQDAGRLLERVRDQLVQDEFDALSSVMRLCGHLGRLDPNANPAMALFAMSTEFLQLRKALDKLDGGDPRRRRLGLAFPAHAAWVIMGGERGPAWEKAPHLLRKWSPFALGGNDELKEVVRGILADLTSRHPEGLLLYLHAQSLYEEGKWKEAIEVLERSVASPSVNTRVRFTARMHLCNYIFAHAGAVAKVQDPQLVKSMLAHITSAVVNEADNSPELFARYYGRLGVEYYIHFASMHGRADLALLASERWVASGVDPDTAQVRNAQIRCNDMKQYGPAYEMAKSILKRKPSDPIVVRQASDIIAAVPQLLRNDLERYVEKKPWRPELAPAPRPLK